MKLRSFYEFRQLVEESDKILRTSRTLNFNPLSDINKSDQPIQNTRK